MNSQVFRDGLFEGQVAVVTGGGTGIGAAITREFARLGARVVIASRTSDVIQRAATGLSEETGGDVSGVTCDIRDREAVAALFDTVIARHGRLDHVVNNGGGQFFAPAEAITPNGFDAVVKTNLTGTWNITRGAADAWMLANGGTLTNITMLTGRAFPGMAHSHAARSGVEALTRTLAVEWAARGIRINSVAPGFIASSGITRYPQGLEFVRTLQRHVPMKRLGTCDEIAWLVAFLHSPAGAYITGQTLTVDGGKALWGDYWPIPDPDPLPPIEIPPDPWTDDA